MCRTIGIVDANGQLGFDLMHPWSEVVSGEKPVGLAHVDIEVRDPESARAALTRLSPQVAVVTSAYHKFDVVESMPERASSVHACSPW
jgi:dTDP-4-dehydrorhamnose reductase